MWQRWGGIFDIDGKRTQYAAEQALTTADNFWNDSEAAEKQLRKVAAIGNWIQHFERVKKECDDLGVLYEFYKAGEIGEEELEASYKQTEVQIEELELRQMLGKPK